MQLRHMPRMRSGRAQGSRRGQRTVCVGNPPISVDGNCLDADVLAAQHVQAPVDRVCSSGVAKWQPFAFASPCGLAGGRGGLAAGQQTRLQR